MRPAGHFGTQTKRDEVFTLRFQRRKVVQWWTHWHPAISNTDLHVWNLLRDHTGDIPTMYRGKRFWHVNVVRSGTIAPELHGEWPSSFFSVWPWVKIEHLRSQGNLIPMPKISGFEDPKKFDQPISDLAINTMVAVPLLVSETETAEGGSWASQMWLLGSKVRNGGLHYTMLIEWWYTCGIRAVLMWYNSCIMVE